MEKVPEVMLPDHSELNVPPVFSDSPERVAEAFALASDPEERLQWVRNPEISKQHWKLYPEEAFRSVPNISPVGHASTQGLVFARFHADFGNGRFRIIHIVQTSNGPKVDWDAYARYQTSSWEDILSGKNKEAQVRVSLKPLHDYFDQYHDDSLWRCYQLNSQDLKKPLRVYARRSSRTGRVLSSVLPHDSMKALPVTLSLESENEGHLRSQFTITRLHGIGWVLGEEDFEIFWKPSLIEEKKPDPKFHLDHFGLPM